MCAFRDVGLLDEIVACEVIIFQSYSLTGTLFLGTCIPLKLVVKAKYDLNTLSIASCVEHAAESMSSSSVTHVHN